MKRITNYKYVILLVFSFIMAVAGIVTLSIRATFSYQLHSTDELLINILGWSAIVLSVLSLGYIGYSQLTSSSKGVEHARNQAIMDIANKPIVGDERTDAPTDIKFFNEIVRINILNLAAYYELVKTHTNRSF